MEPFVATDIANGIATVSFFSPKSNSLPAYLLARLAGAIEAAGQQDAVRIIVLRSEGEKVFCAGAFFDELLAIEDEAAGTTFFSGFANVINAMRRSPRLVVARVQGKCVGGGVGLVAAADFAIATQAASVRLSELTIGIGPFVIGPAVQRKLGPAAFATLALDASQTYDAAWAYTHGLYNKLVASQQELDAEVNSLATALSGYNADAMAALKQQLWQGTGHWETLLYEHAATSGRLILAGAARAALQQFRNK